ncbi:MULTISPECIES: glycosyltransferase family 9 protein [unclassified Mesorhizobium]|uniref:glycosyltransferase family 9 protein n=2 Tax=Mesorhizobium TaxID=68287 RepID=UPI000FCA0D8D|nr:MULTISPECIES: glycosyltransferase family 9 protein [unclassified Mesorhizobium]RUZ86497.1 glycosyltransferase family 9 protein [Mesorhizobium sp. M7A.F.Ca.US.003.02.2.1]RUX71636.1 glycosyltransferase family 9 protein [Mesorhizobium sp. M7A.F.Ca.US.005.03.1.1]RUY07987.1 glycosyltransferase family 9 protein [Mesorhizobium sp. M7A.F.Ca.US.005.03.2.1]RUY96190.1 glycosyltransferase family 9 protein [Mesorhizobium sp. M7A.F.Ca.CA.001.12.2.1]RUZ13782.1 glycosyltransferase family 9 protein [Mesorhi
MTNILPHRFDVLNISMADRLAVKSILVIQAKYIGDVILTSALMRNLRVAYPHAIMAMLCAPGLRDLVVSQGIADIAIGFDPRGGGRSLTRRLKEYSSLVAELRRRKFDLTIDLTDSKTSRMLHKLIGAPMRVGYDPPEVPLKSWESQPANIFAETFGQGGAHYLYRYLSPLRALGITSSEVTPRLEPTSIGRGASTQILAQSNLNAKAFVAVHAGARFEGRCWQPERFAAVIDEVYETTGLRSLLIGGPDESAIAQRILNVAVSPLASVVGKASLETLTALLADAFIFLGNESGPMHLAASVGTPVVGLYGLTPPDVWGPVGVPYRTVEPPLPCQCVAPHLCKPNNPGGVYCVHRLPVAKVAQATHELIEAVRQQGNASVNSPSPGGDALILPSAQDRSRLQ